MTTESEFTNQFLENFLSEDRDGVVRVEEPYNHYGDRGVVDLYTRFDWQTYVYEFKSGPALDHVTGANEIVRQFNHARKYFFEGTDHVPTKSVTFELCFIASERTIHHLANNAEIYATAAQSELNEFLEGPPTAAIRLRPAGVDRMGPVNVFLSNFDCRDRIKDGSWLEYVEGCNPVVAEEYREVLEETRTDFV